MSATTALAGKHSLWTAPRVGLTTLGRVALVAGIAWGAFAFGAVYPWAYGPLALLAAVAALAGFAAPAPSWRSLDLGGVTLALAGFLGAATVQLVPLPLETVRLISPEAPSIVAQLDLTAQLELATTRPLSIDPARTLRKLMVVASLAAMIVGTAKLFSITGAAGTARAIAVLGVLLALTAIIQRPLFTGKIYGFWSPLQGGHAFGPFVNKNHFAGWMLMAIPVTIALLCKDISRGFRGVRPEWRERVVWLSSPDASRLLLLIGATAIMTLSLILTMSRSGMAAGALAILCVALASRYGTRRKRVASIAIISALLVLAIGWAGAGTLANRFASSSLQDVNGRTFVWKDAADIARRYPLAGTGLDTYTVAMLFYQRFNPSAALFARPQRLPATCRGRRTVADAACSDRHRRVRPRGAPPLCAGDQCFDVLDPAGRRRRAPRHRIAGDRRIQSADARQRVPLRGALRHRAAPHAIRSILSSSVLYLGCPPPDRAHCQRLLDAANLSVVWVDSIASALAELRFETCPS